MTIRELMIHNLMERGLFEDQAEQVMDICESELKSMSRRWDDPKDSYNQTFLISLWANVGKIAYSWIEDNYPVAFYKPLFKVFV